ncbi:MAG: DUF4956 domain-containing protein [Rickettsiales bacterium TMED289]|nr:MAG: DUF4956 domain-containing protein [Rickettsiales bacterium TMED289]|tara:strand:+ start:3118 stop:3816 length:699 start_codon:yes stop_codon:yes gene_type:complete
MDTENNTALTFRDILDASTSNLSSGSALTITDVIVGLMVSLVCAGIISWTYRASYQGVLYQKSFNISLILICLITTAVIMVISGNLVLSLGMVGALSIVRFRAAIKDPLDIVFMFWAVSVGIANGVANIKVSLTATILISILMIALNRIPFGMSAFIIIIKYKEEEESSILDTLSKNSKRYVIKSKNFKDDQVELIAEARLPKDNNLSKEFSKQSGIIDFSLLAYSSNILDN